MQLSSAGYCSPKWYFFSLRLSIHSVANNIDTDLKKSVAYYTYIIMETGLELLSVEEHTLRCNNADWLTDN